MSDGFAVQVGHVAQDPVQEFFPAPPAARLGRGGGGRVAAGGGPLRRRSGRRFPAPSRGAPHAGGNDKVPAANDLKCTGIFF